MNEWEWQILEDKLPLDSIELQGVTLRRNDRVRLQPRAGGDVFDLALAGRVAIIESFQQDYEGKVHVCVVVDDDPGKDVGMMRQPGHRFFFAPEEVQPFGPESEPQARPVEKKILVAGIGNIFLGDDAFGVEVANRLLQRTFPAGVRIGDFGIRGFDLAYALMEGYETTILIDAYPGEPDNSPGTLSVIEPDLQGLDISGNAGGFVEPHGMNPINVLRMATGMGAQLSRILLVGCVPATLGPEEGLMGLSAPVAAAVEQAVGLVESLISRVLNGEWPGKQSSGA